MREEIKTITFNNSGYLYCKSNFYTSHDTLQEQDKFHFHKGVNKLVGDIDSGIWGVSYLLSMYGLTQIKKDDFLYPLTATVNEKEMPLSELSRYCCYLDQYEYPLFSSKRKTIIKLIEKGVKKSKINMTADEICNIFRLDFERINRPIRCVGNERFRAMAAVGYAHGKQVFCFPWLSQKMFDYYTNNILWLFEILEELRCIAIVPVGR